MTYYGHYDDLQIAGRDPVTSGSVTATSRGVALLLH